MKDTPPATSQWFLERQANVSVFHEKIGLIVTGAGSRGQPELATIAETVTGRTFHLANDAQLDMTDAVDRLALAYNRFFVSLEVPRPDPGHAELRFVVTGRGPAPDAARLTLQLRLKPGEMLSTGGGVRVPAGKDPNEIEGKDLGGSIRHAGWTLEFDSGARLRWPVYPYNPYRNGPETRLDLAVAALSFPLELRADPKR